MAAPPPRKPRKNRQQTQLLITGGVLGGLVLVGLVAVLASGGGGEQPVDPAVAEAEPEQAPPQQPAVDRPSKPKPPAGPKLIPDNGRTLWASPTAGAEPVPLDALPDGVQLVLSVRLADLLATADGRIVAELLADRLRPIADAGVRLRAIDRLTIGVRQGARYGQIDTTMVIDTVQPTVEPAGEEGAANDPRPAGRTAYGPVYRLSPTRLVIAAKPTVDEIAAASGQPPLLRREMEELLRRSDATRHTTLLAAPSFLFAEGKPVFAGGVAALESPLFEEIPDELRAVMASVHFSPDGFYWELRGAGAAELPAMELSRALEGRVAQWPSELQLAVIDLTPAPHGRRVVANLPAMLGVAARYARRGVVDRHAVINGYLPASAGHNLLLAAELMLAQQSAGVVGGGASGPVVAASDAGDSATIAERLRRRASVSFDRDTLEMAIKYLSDEIGAPMVILGGDLQLDGITKNQSFGLDATDKPGEAILLEILKRANPDKTATGPADPKQKLVYVIKSGPSGAETVFITTRSAAAKRGDKLPAAFQE